MKHLPKLGELVFKGEKLTIHRENYKNNGRVAILIASADGGPFATLSCNVVDAELPDPDCFHVKVWSENEQIAEAIRQLDIFEDTGLKEQTGRVTAPVWALKRYIWIVEHGTTTAFTSEESANEFRQTIGGGAMAHVKIKKVQLRRR